MGEHDNGEAYQTAQLIAIESKLVTSASIVTVCLNARSTIEATLNSVRGQSYPIIEHVVIDGGSTDGTAEVVKTYAPSYFVSEADNGIYYAMQKGAEVARGDVVFFLNSGDTFFDQDVVSDVIEFFNKTGCDAIFGNLFPCYIRPDDTHDHEAFHDQRLMDLSYFNNRKLFFDESIHHQTIFYKRKIFENCGFICENNEANGEYHLNLCAFVARSYSVKHLPRPICRFALGGTSTGDFSVERKRFVRAREVLRRKFFPTGPCVKIEDENEYLYYPPSPRNRLKIYLRKMRLYPLMVRLKSALRRLRLVA